MTFFQVKQRSRVQLSRQAFDLWFSLASYLVVSLNSVIYECGRYMQFTRAFNLTLRQIMLFKKICSTDSIKNQLKKR